MKKSISTSEHFSYSHLHKFLPNSTLQFLLGLAVLLCTGVATPALATGFEANYVVINNTRYYTIRNTAGSEPAFTSVANLGNFDRETGSLTLGAESNTIETGSDDVQSVQLLYRVYLVGSTPPATFTPLPLAFVDTGSRPNARDKKWQNTTSNPNLLAATSGPGTYVLELFFQGVYNFNNRGGGTAFIFDNNSGANYRTTFTVINSGPVQLQWKGTVDNNWFNPLNWDTSTTPVTHAVPTSTTDAVILFNSLPNANYPTISSGVAQVRTLRINGNNLFIGARNFLAGGELQVFGDFQDPNGGFGQSGGIFTLAGGTQTFDGALFLDMRIQGGGTKILTNRMDVISSLSFVNGGGVLTTRTDNAVAYSVDLGPLATINGESETSFVSGILRTQRFVNANTLNTFGNIGVGLTATGSPGVTLATRLTGYVYNGVPPSVSVERSFTFTPENPIVPSFSLDFRYLDSEVNGIFESDLVLFRSLSGGIPFQPLFRTSIDSLNNILTRTDIQGTVAATFTLGNQRVPLPVTLTSFTAVAQGSDALLAWTTAQETSSKGFEVEASADGVSFQKIGFVPSETPNSSAARAYQYRDTSPGKQGTRHYRLRQLDLDGKASFSGLQTVTFSAVRVASVQAHPNPFTAAINLTLQTPAAGPATVTVLDGLGRQVSTWQPTLAAGASTFQLPGLQGLARGLYVVQVRYPDGSTQRLKLLKE